MDDKQIFMLEAYELQTGHYLSLTHALAAALTHCVVWRHEGSDDKYDALQLCRFAEEYDKEHPIQDRSFFMVSAEGAIGISPGLEYLTKWMFIPSMDEESVTKLQNDIRELEAQTKAEEAKEKARIEAEEKAKREAEEAAKREAEEQARKEAEAKAQKEAEEKARKEAEEQARKAAEEQAKREAEEKARKEAEAKAQEPKPAAATAGAKFCPECGTPYKNPNARFCGNCGAPRV